MSSLSPQKLIGSGLIPTCPRVVPRSTLSVPASLTKFGEPQLTKVIQELLRRTISVFPNIVQRHLRQHIVSLGRNEYQELTSVKMLQAYAALMVATVAEIPVTDVITLVASDSIWK